MKNGVNILLNNVNKSIRNIETMIMNMTISYNIVDVDPNINIEIKHLLEDMQSVLDYIAVSIHEKYCNNHKMKKIYYIYAKENETEIEYKKRFGRNFPDLYKQNKKIYKILEETQYFSDKTKWLIILNDITNEVKHNELFILKMEYERNVIISNNDTHASMLVEGNIDIHKYDNGYGVYGQGKVYVSGNSCVSVYSDGTIKIGNGTYNIETKESNNTNVQKYYYNVVKSKKYEVDIISLLKMIYQKEVNLARSIESNIY